MNAFRGQGPHTTHGIGRHARHRKAFLSSSVFGKALGFSNVNSQPQLPGDLQSASRHTLQVGHVGFVQLGLLQSRHNVFCVLCAVLLMSLSVKALLGFIPHLSQRSMALAGVSPLHAKQHRSAPGAIMTLQYALNQFSMFCWQSMYFW